MQGRGIKNEYFLEIHEGFKSWLTRLNYAKGSIRSRSRQLKKFLEWLEEKEIRSLEEVQSKTLKKYNEKLHQSNYSYRTIESYVSVLKLLNDYLENYGEPPLVKIKLEVIKGVKKERRILSVQEIQKLYEACTSDILGNRDRVMLGLYYGCGLRSREGVNLDTRDIDFNNGLLHIRRGKNNQERYVPMSSGVQRDLADWLQHGHRYYSGGKTKVLLPNKNGNRLNNSSLNKRLKDLCEVANIERISLHNLRHSIATHLLESGMALEKISQFLGHRSLEATQVYTRIINK